MGACLGHCVSKILDPISNRFYRRHTRMSSEEDEPVELSQDSDEGYKRQLSSKRLLSFLIMKRFKKRNRGSTLELLEDDDWPRNYNKYILLHSKNIASTSYDSDSSLRTLDPRKLIIEQTGGITSTPGSSLDLEWEHEGIPLCALGFNQKERSSNSSTRTAENSQPSSLTASPWSRVSSPDSLEWDPVEADVVCADLETEHLITEIERLTDKTLRETGEWTESS